MANVLIADDNEDAAASLGMLVQFEGHHVTVVHDGLQALDQINKHHPDLAILDLGMPGLNGLDVCRRVREQAWGHAMRIVALTGWDTAKDKKKTREAGFDGHYAKPVDFDAVKSLLASLDY